MTRGTSSLKTFDLPFVPTNFELPFLEVDPVLMPLLPYYCYPCHVVVTYSGLIPYRRCHYGLTAPFLSFFFFFLAVTSVFFLFVLTLKCRLVCFPHLDDRLKSFPLENLEQLAKRFEQNNVFDRARRPFRWRTARKKEKNTRRLGATKFATRQPRHIASNEGRLLVKGLRVAAEKRAIPFQMVILKTR